jgi:hypothetical protein
MITPSQRRYIAIETAISVVINTIISIGFAYFTFRGLPRIATATLIPDAVPQSFMIALMSTVVPAVLTRKRVLAGTIEPMEHTTAALVRSLPIRAILVAFIAAAAGFVVHYALLTTFAPDGLTLRAVIAFKAAYGAMLAAIVTPALLPFALSDPRHRFKN